LPPEALKRAGPLQETRTCGLYDNTNKEIQRRALKQGDWQASEGHGYTIRPCPHAPQSRGSSLDRTPSGHLEDSTQPPGPLPSLLITTEADTFDRKPPRVAAVMCSGITVNHPTVPRSTPFGSKQYGKMAPSEPFAPVSTFQPCRLPAMSWSQL